MGDGKSDAGGQQLDSAPLEQSKDGTPTSEPSPNGDATKASVVSPKDNELLQYQQQLELYKKQLEEKDNQLALYEKNAAESAEVISNQRRMLFSQAQAPNNEIEMRNGTASKLYRTACVDILKKSGIKPEFVNAAMDLVERCEPDWNTWFKERTIQW